MSNRIPVRVVWNAGKPYKPPELPTGAVWGYWSKDRDGEITKLVKRSMAETTGSEPTITNLSQYADEGLLHPQSSVLIELDGKVIGASVCGYTRAVVPAFGFLVVCAVDEAYRGSTIGLALTYRAIHELRGCGVEWVFSTIYVPDLPKVPKLLKALGCDIPDELWQKTTGVSLSDRYSSKVSRYGGYGSKIRDL